tara:strand:- start:4229 stop:4771 length:543 start_codon:yes stop_codon:yes gene_type:complete
LPIDYATEEYGQFVFGIKNLNCDHVIRNENKKAAFLMLRFEQRIKIMANTERDTVYTNDGNRTVYTRESNGTGWFVGIIVVLALLAIGYLVFSANSGPATTVDVNNTPAVQSTTDPATAPAPMTEAPATAPEAAPMTPAAPAETAPAAAPETAPAAAPAAPTDSMTSTDTTVAPPAAPAQ